MAVKVTGEAAEVARAEAQAVLAMVQDDEKRGRLADLVAAIDDGALEDDDADALAELLELGLQTGRVRAVYGPEGEQATLALFRRLPLGRELTESTRDLNAALVARAHLRDSRGTWRIRRDDLDRRLRDRAAARASRSQAGNHWSVSIDLRDR
jgi:hypothetical protein